MKQSLKSVGIVALEIYFPKSYVSQEDLGASKGKFTVGLGQTNMAFVNEVEDVNSMALTVVQNLLEKYQIDPRSIGRLEVGTETLVDKSKSTKTVLMNLFSKYGNNDIEGVSSINACYGATSALFNTVSWIQSEAWDGRYGIVVASDIAVYDKGPARPTGGAGAIAMLIGPNASIVMEPVRSSYFENAYDFYKPDMNSEYPKVDGQLSVKNFSKAIESCYSTLKAKTATLGDEINLDKIDFCCFHTPYCKQSHKGFLTMFGMDMKNKVLDGKNLDPKASEFIKKASGNSDEKAMNAAFSQYFRAKVQPTLFLSTNLGNIYTGSLYACLISLISTENIHLEDKRILMFSYGSGVASSMFLLKVKSDPRFIADKIKIHQRIKDRIKISAEDYDRVMEKRAQNYGKLKQNIETNIDNLAEGTYYLSKIDENYRRSYERKVGFPLGKNDTSATNKEEELKNDPSMRRLEQLSNHLNTIQTSSPNIQSPQKVNSQLWTGFHKKTHMERLDQLKKIDPELKTDFYKNGGLYTSIADIMVENCIGKLSLPLGLGLNFFINNKEIQIPMALEEPSVIAACSSVAKLVGKFGGFKTFSTEPIMRGQIQLLEVNAEEAIMTIEQKKKEIISYANDACQSMVKRGGGVTDIKVKHFADTGDIKLLNVQASDMLVVDLYINVCDSMGANIINTIVEHTAPFIEHITGGRAGIKILSNLCTERKALTYFEIPVKEMAWKNASGEEVCKKILEAYNFAKNDVYRATTHNKGIMNGIDAAAISCGQDWRAIEAAAHAYPYIKYGKYGPLSNYNIVKRDNGELFIRGSLELPIAVGVIGGVIQNNEIYQNSLRMMGYPTSQQLGEILLCVGLANNFAAIRAMAIEGIQKGHMNLHAKNIALAAGVPHYLAMDAVEFMKRRGKINKDSAKAFLQALDLYSELRTEDKKTHQAPQNLSTFFADISISGLQESLVLNIGLETVNGAPLHISIEKKSTSKPNPQELNVKKQLFGDKGYEWLVGFIEELGLIKFSVGKKNLDEENATKSKEVSYKLKLITILINLLSSSLVALDPEAMREFYNIPKDRDSVGLRVKEIVKDKNISLQYGFSLLIELIKIFEYNIESHLPNTLMKKNLTHELNSIIFSHLMVYDMWGELKKQSNLDFKSFITARQKRLCGTMMLFCDSLLLKTTEINEDLINHLKALGNIYEVECTLVRDIIKWSGNAGDFSIYTYWLIKNGEFLKGENSVLKIACAKEVLALNSEKKRILYSLEDFYTEQYKNTRNVIIKHYGANEQISKLFDETKPSL